MKFISAHIHCIIIVLLGLYINELSAIPHTSRPNIIVFMVDDMGWSDSSVPFWRDEKNSPKPVFLNKRYRTPNIAKLSEQGMIFTNAYAHPVCSPSRCSFMSGMNPARHHVTNWTLHRDTSTDVYHPQLTPPHWAVNGIQPHHTPANGHSHQPLTQKTYQYSMVAPYTEVQALPALLKKQGYITIHCGKAHFGAKNTPGANPNLFGFDYNIAGTEIGGPADYRGSKNYGSGVFKIRGLDNPDYYINDVFLTEALTQEAIKRLQALKQNPLSAKQPFFLYMAHYAIHVPLDKRAYDKRFTDSYKNPNDGHPWSNMEKHYCGLIEGIDKSLGDTLNYLKTNNLDKNTIIFFISDNGGLAISGRLGNRVANYPLSYGKGSIHEGGIRVPMIVSWPECTPSSSVCTTPVIIEDFFPTILEIAGNKKCEVSQTVDGISFIPTLRGEPISNSPRPLLFHLPNIWGEGNTPPGYGPATAMRVDKWKLIYWHSLEKLELFDLSSDIGETQDLSTTHPHVLKKLANQMTQLLKLRKAQMPCWKSPNPFNYPAGKEILYPADVAKKY